VAQLSISPETFTMVSFDTEVIRGIAEKLVDQVGMPDDAVIDVVVDETIPLGRTTMTVDGRHVRIDIEGGALEDPRKLRQLSEYNVQQVLGRLLFRAADRLNPNFGDAPVTDEALTLAQRAAWDTYAEGRLERLGYSPRQHRRRYHFRMRHGFTDVADRVFDRLWTADGLTWADLEAAGAETGASDAA
jgi:hypothetical protein